MPAESVTGQRKQQFLEFCDETSMHGFADWKRSRLMRIFWVIIIIMFFAVAFYQIFMMFWNNFSDPFRAETSPLLIKSSELQIPGVEVCLSNPISAVRASEVPDLVIAQALLYRLGIEETATATINELRWMVQAPKIPNKSAYNWVIQEYTQSSYLQLDVNSIVLDMIVAVNDTKSVVEKMISGIQLSEHMIMFSRAQAIELVLRIYTNAVNSSMPCEADQFKCRDGNCIPIQYNCNNEFDCFDRSDESDCLDGSRLSQNFFDCENGRSILDSEVCNGKDDCRDGSDEEPNFCSTRVCKHGQFRCTSVPNCIDGNRFCDGNNDCSDNSDEPYACNICDAPKSIACRKLLPNYGRPSVYEDGNKLDGGDFEYECVHENELCDGILHCNNAMDEYGIKCTEGKPHPVFDQTVPEGDRCNSSEAQVLCLYGLDDEELEWEAWSQYRCMDGPTFCDMENKDKQLRYFECCNVTFEKQICRSDEFQCSSPKGATWRDALDVQPDLEPEPNWPTWCKYRVPPNKRNPQYIHPLENDKTGFGVCIEDKKVCDGFKDCPNGVDEDVEFINWGFGREVHECPERLWGEEDVTPWFRNVTRSCTGVDDESGFGRVMLSRWCDGIPDCPDGEDEANCGESNCADGALPCASGEKCVSSLLWCDGVPDCDDNSDEFEGCQHCTHTTDFKCGNDVYPRCIRKRKRCDGKADCSNGADEFSCPNVKCQPWQIKCYSTDGVCVSMNRLCDGNKDCPDGSDESELCDIHCDHTAVKNRTFRCPGNHEKCYQKTHKCNYIDDCGDMWDETNCTGMNRAPPDGNFVWNEVNVPESEPELSEYVNYIIQDANRLLPQQFADDNFDIIEIMKYIATKPEEVFRVCTFMNRPFNCSEYTTMTYDSSRGLCYTINVNKYNKFNQTKPEQGLYVLINNNIDGTYNMDGGQAFFPVVSDGLTVSFVDNNGVKASPQYQVPMQSSAHFTMKRYDYDRSVMEGAKKCTSKVTTKIKRIDNYTSGQCKDECYLRTIQQYNNPSHCLPPMSRETMINPNTRICKRIWEQHELAGFPPPTWLPHMTFIKITHPF